MIVKHIETGHTCVNGGVWVVVRDGVHGVELGEVVLIGSIVAVPSHDIERRVER